MRFASSAALIVLGTLVCASAGAQQKINPATQINWPANCQVYNVAQAACPPVGIITFKGDWSSTTNYAVNDAVYYNNGTYISLQSPNLNQNPATQTAYWTLLVSGTGSFSQLTGGTNTTASMVVGSGASMTRSGTGIIDASKIGGVAVAGTPSVGQVPIASSATAAAWTSLQPVFPLNEIGALAHYQFLEGSGTVYHDTSGANACSGGPCDITVTSGTPAGTSAPPWVLGGNAGAGIAMGSSPGGLYGLPTNGIGTSCETIPTILQNQVHTIAFQYYQYPGLGKYNLGYETAYIFGPPSNTGQYFYFDLGVHSRYQTQGSGINAFTNDDTVGLHDIVISIPASGSPTVYFDGVASINATILGAPTLSAVQFVLGCANGSNDSGGFNGQGEQLLFDFLLGSTPATAQAAAQYHSAVANTLANVKSYSTTLPKFETSALQNIVVAVGDSTTAGTTGLTAVAPWAVCMITGTSNCYGAGYTTALPAMNTVPWTVQEWGFGGAGPVTMAPFARYRENQVIGASMAYRVGIDWIGINGLIATTPPNCAWVQTVRPYLDPWLMTLYSLGLPGNPTVDTTTRDPYTQNILAGAATCGYHVINLAEDAFVGKDFQNGTVPYWDNTIGGVHMAPNGYAYVASLVSRVLTNYYNANMTVPTPYSASTVAMNGWDRNVAWNTSANAITGTLPNCIGMGGSGIPYYFSVTGSNSLTLIPATVTGQTETINLTTSQVFPAGKYKLQINTYATQNSDPGGCDWEQAQ